MKQKIFDEKKYPKKCANCFFGRMPLDGVTVLCEKKGVVDPETSCKHYKYDPLKRIPPKPVMDTGFTLEDFSL